MTINITETQQHVADLWQDASSLQEVLAGSIRRLGDARLVGDVEESLDAVPRQLRDFCNRFESVNREIEQHRTERKGLSAKTGTNIEPLEGKKEREGCQTMKFLEEMVHVEAECERAISRLNSWKTIQSTEAADEEIVTAVCESVDAVRDRWRQADSLAELAELQEGDLSGHSVARLKRFVEEGDAWDDARWESEVDELNEQLERRIVTAAIRGRLNWNEFNNNPETT